MGAFMDMLRSSREVYQQTSVQPVKVTVGKPEYKGWAFLQWDRRGAAIHATRDMLSAPAWGSTKPNDFISIQGAAPAAPVVVGVPTVAGSNAPQGGLF